MKLRLKFKYNEDFRDSFYLEEQKVILILNEYNLLIFSAITMGLLDIEQMPFDPRSLIEPFKLHYWN